MENTVCLSKKSFSGMRFNFKVFYRLIDLLSVNSFHVKEMEYNNINWLDEVNQLDTSKKYHLQYFDISAVDSTSRYYK